MVTPGDDRTFPGSSEMAALMRRTPWAATPVGDPASWPHALQAIVRVLLTSRFAMWLGWGSELTFLYNDAYAHMTLGAKHPWALGRPSREVWAEIWPQIGPRIEHVLRTGEATWDEALLLFLERSGYPEETYHTFSYSPLAGDDGTVGGLLCVVSEETERVIGARRLGVLREVAAAIAAADSEAALWHDIGRALESPGHDTPFAVIGLAGDDGRRLVAASGGARALRTWPAELVAGEGAAVLALPGLAAAWPTGPWDRPSTHVRVMPFGEGGVGVVVAGLNPYRALDEAYAGFLDLLTDQIAAGLARVRAAEAERRRAEALAQLDRAKTTFFANVSHEFRTPLTLLLGPIEDALANQRPLGTADLEVAYRNALRLLKLVNTLLDFARVEAGRDGAVFAPTDLAALTRDVASTFRAATERAGLIYDVSCDTLPAPIHVDRGQWETIVLNLISNAFKFTLSGRIGIALTAADGGAELVVEDSGIGMTADDLAHVFDRFHRVDGAQARTHEGSGIGLALVRELVHRHGGTITAESTPGRGSRFVVRLRGGTAHLPAGHVAAAPPARSGGRLAVPFVEEAQRWTAEAAVADGPGPADGPRVVVADDNADMRDYVARLLAPRWRVETAADGRAALAALRRAPADLLITDVMMPAMDGLELLRAVRGDSALRDLPVLLLSARSGEAARLEGLDAGADDYLFKPFSAKELVARVRNQLELSRARRQAATERDRLRELLGHVPAVVNFLVGPDLVFDFAHPLAVKAVGGRRLVGLPLLEAMPEHVGQPFADMLQRVYRTGESVAGHEMLARLDRSGTGVLEDSYWNSLYLPVRAASGEIEGVMTFDLEVTEQVRARQQLEAQADALAAAREQAELASRAKDDFLAMLGHELRNPLAPILTALDLLRLQGVRSREHDIIQRQVAHLTRLVDDLLDVSRVTRGMIELQRRPVEMAHVVARALELAAPLLEERRHRLEIDVPAHGVRVDADLERLAQAVVNLLTNAAKYSDPESRIVVRGRRDEGVVELRVRDEGVGIPREMQARIFDPFVQQPQTLARSRGGLGLGLTIVRTLVEKHGGAVAVRSAETGRGSEFVITLPAASGPSPASQPVADAPAVPQTPRRHVLVVDDNADAAEMLAALLEHLGYTVDRAGDGEAALAQARRHPPDLAVLDIGLPGMDGYELARRLREEHGDRAGVRYIAVTGYGQAQDAARAAAAGFAAHLAKPVDVARLRAALDGATD